MMRALFPLVALLLACSQSPAASPPAKDADDPASAATPDAKPDPAAALSVAITYCIP